MVAHSNKWNDTRNYDLKIGIDNGGLTALNELNLSSNGIYSSLGYYEFEELVDPVQFYATKIDKNINEVLTSFGCWLFSVLYNSHANIVVKYEDPIEFLSTIEKHIHFEVKKMYPSASLPKIHFSYDDPRNTAILKYFSHRPLASLCVGLVTCCLQHFGTFSDTKMQNSISADGHAMQLNIILGSHDQHT